MRAGFGGRGLVGPRGDGKRLEVCRDGTATSGFRLFLLRQGRGPCRRCCLRRIGGFVCHASICPRLRRFPLLRFLLDRPPAVCSERAFAPLGRSSHGRQNRVGSLGRGLWRRRRHGRAMTWGGCVWRRWKCDQARDRIESGDKREAPTMPQDGCRGWCTWGRGRGVWFAWMGHPHKFAFSASLRGGKRVPLKQWTRCSGAMRDDVGGQLGAPPQTKHWNPLLPTAKSSLRLRFPPPPSSREPGATTMTKPRA